MRGLLLRAGVSIGLLALALSLMDFPTLASTLSRGTITGFAGAVAINLLLFFVLAIRWHWLAGPTVRVPFRVQAGWYFRGTFLNSFTPANIGGDAYRFAVMRSSAGSSLAMLKLLLRERFLGLYGYLMVYAAVLGLTPMPISAAIAPIANPFLIGGLFAVAGLTLSLVSASTCARLSAIIAKLSAQRWMSRVEQLLASICEVASIRGAFRPMLLTLLSIFLWVAGIALVAADFGLTVSLPQLAAVAVLVEIIRLVPVTIQGIGLREGTFAYLLGLLGHNPEDSFVVATMAYLALSSSILVCGLIGAGLGTSSGSETRE